MKIALFITTFNLLMVVNASVFASDIDLDNYQPLVSDVRAYNIGEPIVVFVIESTSAESSATTGVEKNTSVNAGASDNHSSKSVGFGVDAVDDGAGKTVRKGRVNTQLSATIIEILPNNLLKIEGTQNITINGETQSIYITGVVRTKDITKDNSIYSYQLANVGLEIVGDGVVSNAQRKNIFSWVLGWLGLL